MSAIHGGTSAELQAFYASPENLEFSQVMAKYRKENGCTTFNLVTSCPNQEAYLRYLSTTWDYYYSKWYQRTHTDPVSTQQTDQYSQINNEPDGITVSSIDEANRLIEQFRLQGVILTLDNFTIINQTENYYVLSPSGSVTDPYGNVVRKIRSLQILPLTDDQVEVLRQQGYEVVLNTMDITTFVGSYNDPISYNGAIINNQPVTIMADGTTSSTNTGNFTPPPTDNYGSIPQEPSGGSYTGIPDQNVTAYPNYSNPDFADSPYTTIGGFGIALMIYFLIRGRK